LEPVFKPLEHLKTEERKVFETGVWKIVIMAERRQQTNEA